MSDIEGNKLKEETVRFAPGDSNPSVRLCSPASMPFGSARPRHKLRMRNFAWVLALSFGQKEETVRSAYRLFFLVETWGLEPKTSRM